MKNFIPKTGILAVFLIMFIIGCEKDVSKIIEPDNDTTPPQTLIIEKAGPSDMRILNGGPPENNSSSISDLSRLFILREHQKYPAVRNDFPDWPDRNFAPSFYSSIELVKPTPEPNGIYQFADLNKATLNGFEYEKSEHNGKRTSIINGVTYKMQGGFIFSLEIDWEDTEAFFASVNLGFSISGSPVVQDLTETIDLPFWNTITNITPGEVFNANEDLLITTQYPVTERFFIMPIVYTPRESGYRMSGSGAISLNPPLPGREFIVPSEAILELMEEHPDANMFHVVFTSPRNTKQIQLYDHDGNPYQILNVYLRDFNRMEINFEKPPAS